MFKEEYHIHCEFSDDSREPMENQVKRAIELGVEEMCFTDHVDYGIKKDWDDPDGIEYRGGDGINSSAEEQDPLANVDYPKYFEKIARLQKEYKNQIVIKNGLEFGVQSITVDAFNKLYDRYRDTLDFTLFSMHQVDNLEFWTQDFQRGKTQEEYNRQYYNEILKTMKMFKHYSVLAHLDLIVRYDKNGVLAFEKVEDIVAEILKQAIRDDKGIEINTSSWHYGLADTQPSRNILKLYKDLGGKIITIGSDAHNTKFVADHYEDAVSILKNEIGIDEICTFDKMIPTFHKI